MDNLEQSEEIFTLTDEEDGVTYKFHLYGILEVEGVLYYGLIPYYENAEALIEEDTELVIMKVFTDENGDESFAEVDDEEYDRIGQMFLEANFDEDDEDTEDTE